MNGKHGLRLPPIFTAVSVWTICLIVPSRRADADTPTWDPGHRTTARLPGEAEPDDRPYTDGVYERLDGDVTFTVGLGAEIGSGARGAVSGRVLYYHTGGIIAGYADAFGSDSAIERVAFFGGEVRPLFLPRWSVDAEFGVPMLDLVLDSLSFGAGAYVGTSRGGDFGNISGLEGAVGFGVPLTQSATGFWLEVRGTYRTGLPEGALGALVSLSLYAPWVSPLVR